MTATAASIQGRNGNQHPSPVSAASIRAWSNAADAELRCQAASSRIELALRLATRSDMDGGPPLLAAAVQHAVFPGGARLRPKLALAVAMSVGDGEPALADTGAAAVELMHCASLVHDDLPCFDAADERRGAPTVHRAFGEAIAVLTGDHLIVLAFQILAKTAVHHPLRAAQMIGVLARSVGSSTGLIAGQAWESEPRIPGRLYRRAKTGALFEGAAAIGAIAAGDAPEPWIAVGAHIGEAYQVADDIVDVVGSPSEMGKPAGRDATLGRPNAVAELGMAGALQHFRELVERAHDAVPSRANSWIVRMWVEETRRRIAKVIF